MSLTQKWVKKVQVSISCTNVDRKMKIKSKKYFGVNCLFMKLFSQNFEVLAQRGGVINPKLAQKQPNLYLMYSNGDRKMKISSKRNFQVRYLFMKLSKS